jgi:hypothetical protein
MTLTVTLTGCPGLSDRSRIQAEGACRASLLHTFGGSDGARRAFEAHRAACQRHGGPPIPLDADPADREAAQRWEDAAGVAAEHAFAGWPTPPYGAAFGVELEPETTGT